jgi:hypothetical protein
MIILGSVYWTVSELDTVQTAILFMNTLIL